MCYAICLVMMHTSALFGTTIVPALLGRTENSKIAYECYPRLIGPTSVPVHGERLRVLFVSSLDNYFSAN